MHTRREAAAEDVVQEAFARLAATSRRSRARDYSLAYVRRCVVNASRSSWRRRVVALRKWPLLTVGVARADDHDPALATFERLDLVRALRKLPRRQREVLVLRYYADLTEANVAELLDISVGAVKSYSARGLAGLRASLESLDEHT